MDKQALEIAKGIEYIALERGLSIRECIASAIEMLQKQKEKKIENQKCRQAYKSYYREIFKGW